jgi:ubiquinone/menaquinone biosynthesis C-methylase UbiE
VVNQSVNFDRAAEYYDRTRGFPEGIAPQVGAFIAEKLDFSDNAHLLEVGVGTGRIALPLAPHVASITGFDISWQMMSKLRAKQNGEPIRLSAADAHFMPFANQHFDAAYLTHVLHLVADPVRVAQEIMRVVKEDGVFVHMRNRYNNTAQFQHVVDAWDTVTKPNVDKGLSRWNRINGAIAEAGWTLEREEIFTFTFTSHLPDFLERIEKRQWSSTWLMDDDTWRRGLDAVYAAIDEHYGGDRDVSGDAEGSFVVQVYKRA